MHIFLQREFLLSSQLDEFLLLNNTFFRLCIITLRLHSIAAFSTTIFNQFTFFKASTTIPISKNSEKNIILPQNIAFTRKVSWFCDPCRRRHMLCRYFRSYRLQNKYFWKNTTMILTLHSLQNRS